MLADAVTDEGTYDGITIGLDIGLHCMTDV